MKDRVYVCHTFYHVYVSVIKELNRLPEDRKGATILLSTMSNDFGDLKDRLIGSGLFDEVYMYEEKVPEFFPELKKYSKDRGNLVLNLLQRIVYTKKLGRLEEKYLPVDMKEYKDIYVYCDSDPVAYYLSYRHIYYHAVEDGLDCIRYLDNARYSNRGHFELKAWMAAHNIIFIDGGYAKYCLDMEVNDTSVIKYRHSKYKEVNREALVNGVSPEDIHYLVDIFIENAEELLEATGNVPGSVKKIMILSDPVCDEDTRARLMRDIVDRYAVGARVFIKPHPRDKVDYHGLFEDCVVIRGRFPMEIMNYIPQMHMDAIVSILTPLDEIKFADEKILLGRDFMDFYEEPAIHRQNEVI
ncbi:MAG: lipooligosaccharide sialyltransferase [Lachnospiraceae bacterium]|nr:lipooligosaccharide sialyltransferase [Lachnospiraceae bacterium]